MTGKEKEEEEQKINLLNVRVPFSHSVTKVRTPGIGRWTGRNKETPLIATRAPAGGAGGVRVWELP